ncbi:hypothetical protein P4C99_05030 [Pontiellaceae bacterium B1224]|nr:hypothetical protein [Pontiellaceae bacterium B1224]
MLRALLIGLLLCGIVLASPADQSSKDWKQFRTNTLALGLLDEQVDGTLAACRSKGLSLDEVQELFSPVYAAKAESLPVDCVFLKIEEGLAKGVSWKSVRVAGEQRLESLRTANQMIMQARKQRGGQHAHLVSHTCLALESGLSVEALNSLFSRPGRFRYGRLIHTVEAGESLKLAGLSDEHTLLIMNECLDRELTGAEVFRVVDVISSGLRNGADFEVLHATLWTAAD